MSQAISGHAAFRTLTTMDIVVLAESSHADTLHTLQKNQAADLTWEEIDEADTMQLLELLKLGQSRYSHRRLQ